MDNKEITVKNIGEVRNKLRKETKSLINYCLQLSNSTLKYHLLIEDEAQTSKNTVTTTQEIVSIRFFTLFFLIFT